MESPVLSRIKGLGPRGIAIAVGAVGIVAIVIVLAAFKPITRTVAANKFVCFGCHFAQDFDTDIENPITKVHPEEGERRARCVDCHVPDTLVGSAFVYTHFLGHTDLFGNGRDLQKKIAGPYHAPAAKKAYAVRDALQKANSSTCRTCHIEEEIKPKRPRGRNAHAQAKEKGQTCIECHFNLVHTEVDLPPVAQ